MSEGKEVAVAGNALPQGYENVTAEDILMPRVKAWSGQTKVEVEGGKIGRWYEVNAAKDLGESVRFSLLGTKTVKFMNTDSNGEEEEVVYKHLLVAMEGTSDVPTEIVVSRTGIVAVKKLVTTLILKSKEKGGAPSFAFVCEGKLKKMENEKGRWAVPEFTVVGETAPEAFDAAASLYSKYAAQWSSKAAHPEAAEPAANVDVSNVPM